MIRLTDEQVVATVASDRLVNIVSEPGSGKTTVAAHRFGFRRLTRGDQRGVLGLSFTRSAVAEFRNRVTELWGSDCLSFPHALITFDSLHVELLQSLIQANLVHWPNAHKGLEIVDNYQAYTGYRWLTAGNYRRVAILDSNQQVISSGMQISNAVAGIGNLDSHKTILESGVCSHEDVRELLTQALILPELKQHITDWLKQNFRELVIDEVFDANKLDLDITKCAIDAGLAVTAIGDPWQALYEWRGATPESVAGFLASDLDSFKSYQLSHSFRFVSHQMKSLAKTLRSGKPAVIPAISSFDVNIALARNWNTLWRTGENVLPLAFRNLTNRTDSAINLLLDTYLQSQFRVNSYGRDAAITILGLDQEVLNQRQKEVFEPLLRELALGTDVPTVLAQLRRAVMEIGTMRKITKLKISGENQRHVDLKMLSLRLRHENLIHGLTIFQAKGREWDRIGVALSKQDQELLAQGLSETRENDRLVYVALTRAKEMCGRLAVDGDLELPLSSAHS